MSKFYTIIPVNVQSIIKALPAGTFVDSVTIERERGLNQSPTANPIGLRIEWSNDKLKTPYTFAQEYSVNYPVNKLVQPPPIAEQLRVAEVLGAEKMPTEIISPAALTGIQTMANTVASFAPFGTCQQCGKKIVSEGGIWKHAEGKPRHPAIPKV